jgi:hypothetical protein
MDGSVFKSEPPTDVGLPGLVTATPPMTHSNATLIVRGGKRKRIRTVRKRKQDNECA